MKETVANFKENFFHTCQKYELPMQNKAIFYYQLSSKILEQPNNTELRDLLITALCAGDFLLSHYPETLQEEYEIEHYKWIKKQMSKLTKAIDSDRQLPKLWEKIYTTSLLPKADSALITAEHSFEKETNFLTFLFRDTFEISENTSNELYYNLHHFVCITKSDPTYRSIAPLFFTQLMVRHKKRLATKECLNVSAKSLWDYKSYTITNNNEKNYKMYDHYFYLFRKLCKYYKHDPDVNIELAKYGFHRCSNVTEWIEFAEAELMKKCMTKLDRMFCNLSITYQEPGEPDEFGLYTAYALKDKKINYFFETYCEIYMDIEGDIFEYLLEHIEYVVDCMYHMYEDALLLRNIVNEIYQNAHLENKYPSDLPLNYRLSHVYEVLTTFMNKGVEARVKEALLNN